MNPRPITLAGARVRCKGVEIIHVGYGEVGCVRSTLFLARMVERDGSRLCKTAQYIRLAHSTYGPITCIIL